MNTVGFKIVYTLEIFDHVNSQNSAPETDSVSVPPKLWEASWSPPTRLSSIPIFFGFERSSRIFESIAEEYRIVHDGVDPPFLSIHGSDTYQLLEQYIAILRQAVTERDFTSVLSSNRLFEL